MNNSARVTHATVLQGQVSASAITIMSALPVYNYVAVNFYFSFVLNLLAYITIHLLISLLPVIYFKLSITRTPNNSNFFRFPLKVRVIESRLYDKLETAVQHLFISKHMNMWQILLKKCWTVPRENSRTETETHSPVQPLRYVNFTKFIFRPIKSFKLISSWFP